MAAPTPIVQAPSLNLPISAYLSTKDRLDYESLELLGGDGSDYTTFFDDFEQLAIVGTTTYPTTSSYWRPQWGYLVNAGTGVVGRADANGPSGFSVGSLLTQIYVMNGLSSHKWSLSWRGKITKGTSSSDGSVVHLNHVTGQLGFGIQAGSLTTLKFGNGTLWGWAAPNVVTLATVDADIHQVDMICLGDEVVKCRLDYGSWASLSVPDSPGTACELCLQNSNDHNLWSDWIYLRTAREI